MDLDNDGNIDLLSGCYQGTDGPEVFLYKGQKGGELHAPESVKNKKGERIFANLDVRSTHPFACDWDGDGDLDLIIGVKNGDFFYAQNMGNRDNPEFSDTIEKLSLGEKTGSDHPGSSPHVIDWDGDGDLDLLTGTTEGGVLWSENTGNRKNPVLTPLKVLVPKPPKEMRNNALRKLGSPPLPGGYTRIWATDFNGDGKLDLLVGDNILAETIAYNPHLSPEQNSKLAAKAGKTRDALMVEIRTLQQKIRTAVLAEDETAMALHQKRYAKLNAQIGALDIRVIDSGFIWLYLRK